MLNKQALFKLLILAGYGGFMIYLLYTGKISLYVHPKMNKYIYGCVAVLMVFLIVVLGDLFKGNRRSGNQGSSYGVFAAALLLAVLIQPGSLNSALAQNRGVSFNLNPGSAKTVQVNPEQSDASQNTGEDSLDQTAPQQGSDDIQITNETQYDIDENGVPQSQADPYKKSIAADLTGPEIVVNDENYMQTMDGIYSNMSAVMDKKITISGFVFREEGMKSNNFIVARSMITCCVADAAVGGFMCDFGPAGELKNDEWIEVNGILQQTDYKGETVPVIMVKGYKKIEKPKNEYLFAY